MLQENAVQVIEAPTALRVLAAAVTLEAPGLPWRPMTEKVERDMNIARKVAIAVVTATMSVGLLGISAPAHADIGWSTSIQK